MLFYHMLHSLKCILLCLAIRVKCHLNKSIWTLFPSSRCFKEWSNTKIFITDLKINIPLSKVIFYLIKPYQIWQHGRDHLNNLQYLTPEKHFWDLQPIRVQSDTYYWPIFVLSSNQPYMQWGWILGHPCIWWGDTSLSPFPISGVKITSESDKPLLMNEIHYHFTSKIFQVLC